MGEDCCGHDHHKPKAVHAVRRGGVSDPGKAPEAQPLPPHIIRVANFLRSSAAQLKVKQGVLNGKRVDFFKGKAAVNALMRENYAKSLKTEPFTDKQAAEKVLVELLQYGVFVQVDRTTNKKQVVLSKEQVFDNESFYVWLYQGSQVKGLLMGLGVMLITLAGVMFPLWPASLRVGVYYLSLGLLGLMGAFFGLAIVRLIVWVVTLVAMGRGGWLFPNLFADCGVIESFIPYWSWDEKKASKKKE